MSEKMEVTLDLNKFLEAYTKEDFMKKVFSDFLKNNSNVISDAIGNYVVMDLIKSGEMDAIAKSTKEALAKTLNDMGSSFSSPIRASVNQLVSQCVSDNKSSIDKKVKDAINSDLTNKDVVSYINGFVERRITSALRYASEED